MSRRALLVLGIAALLFSVTQLFAAPLRDDETLKLASGHVVKVLSVSQIEYSKGVMALMVRYQTSLSIDQRQQIDSEVDDVWKLTQKQVEHLGYTAAIISSNEVPRGIFLTTDRMLNFIFEKGPDGKWTRLNRADFMAQQ